VLIKPELPLGVGPKGVNADAVREYICEHCGCCYLARRLPDNRLRVCSNECKRKRRNTRAVQARRGGPPADYARINAARTLRRAEARAGRVCATLRSTARGGPFDPPLLFRHLPGEVASGREGPPRRFPGRVPETEATCVPQAPLRQSPRGR
jgi:hypothetical protein